MKRDRSIWLNDIRRALEEQEDLLAPGYDENWGEIAPMHLRFIERFLGLCPPLAHLLDAACGTGKYWGLILTSGRTVFGIDQSLGALRQAREKYPDVPNEKVGLQEMDFDSAFDGAICMDALEMISPEDWPLVMRNLYRAVAPEGYFYFTVEIAPEGDVQAAFAEGQRLGLPVVYGEAEWVPDTGYHWERGGWYHYYPRIEQVKAWVEEAGFRRIDDRFDGEEYHHFLVQKPG